MVLRLFLAFAILSLCACATTPPKVAHPALTASEDSTSTAAPPQELSGTFEVVAGKVQVKSEKTGEVRTIKTGDQIHSHESVITDKTSRAKVMMADNNELHV